MLINGIQTPALIDFSGSLYSSLHWYNASDKRSFVRSVSFIILPPPSSLKMCQASHFLWKTLANIQYNYIIYKNCFYKCVISKENEMIGNSSCVLTLTYPDQSYSSSASKSQSSFTNKSRQLQMAHKWDDNSHRKIKNKIQQNSKKWEICAC